MIKCNIIIGRFQPITTGHIDFCEKYYQTTGIPTVLAMIEVNSPDERHPFLTRDILPKYRELFNRNNAIIDIVLIKNANIVTLIEKLNDNGFEPVSLVCGTDRYKAYKRMVDKYVDDNNFKIIEVPRNDNDISATKMRTALLNDDKWFVKKYTPIPKSNYSIVKFNNYYELLRSLIMKVYGK